MKNRKIPGSLALLCLLTSALASSDSGPITFKPQLVRLIPQYTFIPPGFDDNDNVQLIVSGYLPNTCYRAGPASVQVDQVQKTITIQNTAYLYSGCWCGQMIVPYLHTVNLGILPGGEYQVFVQDQKDKLLTQGVLNVAASKTSTPDDYLYAPIQDVFLDQPSSSQPTLVIRGQFSSDCMHSQETRVLYRAPHIIEVLPIASMDEGRDCHAASISFEWKVQLQSPQGWEKGTTLIYVRSLNGQAVSKVVDL